MKKTVVVMQPGYLPWLGFFELLAQSDIFVLYDNVQYDKNGWRNRNRIKTPNGPLYLTVPVTLPNGLATKINEAKIADNKWQKKHLGSIEQFYRKAPFFEKYFPMIKEMINGPFDNLLSLDAALIVTISSFMGMEKEIIPASSLNINEPDRVKRLIEIVKALGGNRFYEAAGGKTYLGEPEVRLFREHGIDLEFQNYQHPVYRQLHGEFIPCLSTLDLLFNEGPESGKILSGK